jgi:hypothetical protein
VAAVRRSSIALSGPLHSAPLSMPLIESINELRHRYHQTAKPSTMLATDDVGIERVQCE